MIYKITLTQEIKDTSKWNSDIKSDNDVNNDSYTKTYSDIKSDRDIKVTVILNMLMTSKVTVT